MNILIVDDEREFRESLADLIHLETDCHVDLAANGKEALELCSSNNYELLIIDYRMPLMNGVDFFKILSADNNKNLKGKILFLSGFVDEISLEIQDFISIEFRSKPLKPQEFLKIVEKVRDASGVAA